MRFAQFMASTTGRGLRVAAGLILLAAGIWLVASHGSLAFGIVLIAIGALFATVGSINVCPLAPIFGGPFNGRKATQR